MASRCPLLVARAGAGGGALLTWRPCGGRCLKTCVARVLAARAPCGISRVRIRICTLQFMISLRQEAFLNACIDKLVPPLEQANMARREALLVAVMRSRLHRLCALTEGPKAELFARLYQLQKSRYEQEVSDMTGDVGGAAGPTRVNGRGRPRAAAAGGAGARAGTGRRPDAAGGAGPDIAARRNRWRDRNDEPLVAGAAMQRASLRTSPRAVAAATRARMAWAAPPSGVPAPLDLPPPGDVLTDARRYLMVAQSPDALAAASAAAPSASPSTRPTSPKRSGRTVKPGVPVSPTFGRAVVPPPAPQPNGRVTRSAGRAVASAQATNGAAPARGGLVRGRPAPAAPPPPPAPPRQRRHRVASAPPPAPPAAASRQARHRVAPVRSTPAPAPAAGTGQRRASKRRGDGSAGALAGGSANAVARQTRSNHRSGAGAVSPSAASGSGAPRAPKRARRA